MDLYGWIVEQIGLREEAAQGATRGPWFAEHPEERWGEQKDAAIIGQGKPLAVLAYERNGHLNADHMALNGPDAVLRRCAADRRLLERHRPKPDGSGFPDMLQCPTCSQDGGDGYRYLVYAPCPTLQDLADGYGWTEP